MKWFKLIKKTLLIVLPVILALGAGWLMRSESEFFIVRELPVEIQSQPEQQALLKSLKVDLENQVGVMKGLNIWKMSLSGFQAKLLENPWIQSVEVSRRFPDRIATHIQLKEIPLVYVTTKNSFFGISRRAEKLPELSANIVPTVPILRNNNIISNKKQLQALIDRYEEIPSIGPLKRQNIASVDFDSVSGLQLKLIDEDLEVHLGAVNIQTKALQVLRVIDYLKSQKHKARVIDASFTKKVLVRLRKRS